MKLQARRPPLPDHLDYWNQKLAQTYELKHTACTNSYDFNQIAEDFDQSCLLYVQDKTTIASIYKI